MSADFASERNVRARKPHRCGECSRTIQPGETYQRAAGCWWGDFWHMVTCAHCAALRPMVRDVDAEYNEDYYGGLSEYLACWGRGTLTLPLLRATANMNRDWTRRDGTLVEVPGGVS